MMSHQRENTNKESKSTKENQMEILGLKNTRTVTQNLLEGTHQQM